MKIVNLLNIARHFVALIEEKFSREISRKVRTKLSQQQPFEVVESFKNSHFSELDAFETFYYPKRNSDDENQRARMIKN
jgi:hypothetical protein